MISRRDTRMVKSGRPLQLPLPLPLLVPKPLPPPPVRGGGGGATVAQHPLRQVLLRIVGSGGEGRVLPPAPPPPHGATATVMRLLLPPLSVPDVVSLFECAGGGGVGGRRGWEGRRKLSTRLRGRGFSYFEVVVVQEMRLTCGPTACRLAQGGGRKLSGMRGGGVEGMWPDSKKHDLVQDSVGGVLLSYLREPFERCESKVQQER